MKKSTEIYLSSNFMISEEKGFGRLAPGVWTPEVDLCETKNSITVRVEVPGVSIDDLSIKLRGGHLLISGIKREPQIDEKPLCYICLERVYGEFNREIQILWPIDAENAKALLNDGVLTIDLPKIDKIIEVPITKRP